jgi:hypothetical protein
MWEMTNDPDVDFQVAIESLTDMRKLPFCADCFGELGWAELIYGSGGSTMYAVQFRISCGQSAVKWRWRRLGLRAERGKPKGKMEMWKK